MLGVADIWTYLVGTIVVVLLPGPNSLFVLTTAARHGVRAGYRAAAGVFLGDWTLMAAAALGVASLLRAYPPLFLVIKYAGAAYLAYVGAGMAIRALRRARGSAPSSASPAESSEPSTPDGAPAHGARLFRRALLISLLNPKAILFVISFFIQFIDPTYAYPALSFLVLALILQVVSITYLSVLIFGGTFVARQFRQRRRLARVATAGIGMLFVGFGVRLATG